MRTVYLINDNWKFCKTGEQAEIVNIPHCYNSVDGQDGSKMYRGLAQYEKVVEFEKSELAKNIYLEVGAASLSCKVLINNALCYESRCGFSLHRVNITKLLKAGENHIKIEVNNGVDNTIYPAMADFSFYGGIYRDVNIIVDEDVHFCETGKGLDGVFISNDVTGTAGKLSAEIFIDRENDYSDQVTCELQVLEKSNGCVVATASQNTTEDTLTLVTTIDNVHLWDGIDDPFLYDVIIKLYDKTGRLCDCRSISSGFRTIEYNTEQGLQLNGHPYKLHGVAKHQDFAVIGNAITEKEMQRDLELILELGANSVRCSHYQHCDRWYELCDQAGLLVWAEIPVISSVPQKAEADKNAFEQLELLINQVRNHCSIYCYGVQNEVCMISKNKYTFDLVDRLSKRAKELDCRRFTAQANEYTTEDDCPILDSTDILGFNYYYGWYYGTIEELQPRLDSVHSVNSGKPIILTEYGVDTNPRFHSDTPKANDYSEEYQLLFSENAINAIEERNYMAGGYVWNMFDFGSAGRDEGGEKGKNQKGLVTIDREVKKDAFYLYKAHWSKDRFVYIAGRRYVNRVASNISITVISNLDEITLKVNGKIVETKKVDSAMTVFTDVEIELGDNNVEAYCEKYTDSIVICGVTEPDESYVCPKTTGDGNAVNWFEGLNPDTMEKVEIKELLSSGFTFEDSICDIFSNEDAKEIFVKYLNPIVEGPRFDEGSPISVNTLLGFVKALKIPESLLIACEQELNTVNK